MPLDFGFSNNNAERKESSSLGVQNVQPAKKEMDFSVQNPRYSFEDIVLDDDQLNDIKMVMAYETNKDLLMNIWGMKKLYPERKGLMINLYGESGTGKTMVAHAIASALKKLIIVVNYAEIESKYVGETSKNLVRLFKEAEEKNVVLLFDEADALLSKRVTNMMSSNDVSVNQTKSVLLNILNEFGGIVVFTTNFISNYDFAFMRRIPFQIKFNLPNEEQRKRLWKHYLSVGIPYTCDIDGIAAKYEDVSGSDISNAVWMAALDSVNRQENFVCENRIINAVEKIIKAKSDNQNKRSEKDDARIVSVREVDEEYALGQIEKGRNGL